MLLQIGILLVAFTGFFFLWKWAYPLLEGVLTRWHEKRIEKMTPRLSEMFMEVSLQKLVLIDVVGPIGAGILGFILTQNWMVAGGFAVVGLIVPFIVIKQLENARRRKFANQLIDGLMVLSSSLKAGLSLLQAFESLAEEMPPPISQEFTLVIRQIQMGVSLETALYNMKKRMHVDELDMVVTSIMVARETGGNLTEILTQVSTTIRERNRLIGRVNALCIQAKLQGIIMSILPVVFGIFVYKVDTRFFDMFLQDDMGKMLMAYAVVSEILGVFFIRKFSTIDI